MPNWVIVDGAIAFCRRGWQQAEGRLNCLNLALIIMLSPPYLGGINTGAWRSQGDLPETAATSAPVRRHALKCPRPALNYEVVVSVCARKCSHI